jgi:ankyrin repeat protein
MLPGRGRTALGEASAHANMDVIMLLLAAGADLNVRNMPYGRTALHIAVDSGNADIARLLLLHGADANIKNDRVRNSTPLHWASSKGHVDIINLLLQVATSPTPIHSLAITLSCRRVPTSTSPPTTIEPLCTGLLTGGKRMPPPRSSTQARNTASFRHRLSVSFFSFRR